MIAAASAANASRGLWYLTRGTGVVSLVLLTASVLLGVTTTVRWENRAWPRWIVEGLHRNVSLLVVVFIGIHVATTVVDGFAPIAWIDAVVPFRSPYRPVWLGLGALSLDMLLAVVLTSIMRARLGHRLWRAVHWLAYACWPVALVHALGTGSDARQTWMLALAAASVCAVVGAVAWRLTVAGPEWAPARLAAAGAAVLLPLAVAVWTVLGPLRPGWARLAGTPVALTARVTPAAAPDGGSPAPAAPGPAATEAAATTPTAFTATFDGTMSQSSRSRDDDEGGFDDGGSVTIDLAGSLTGGPFSALDLRLRGRPLATGGVALQASQVTLGPVSDPGAWQGEITALSGGDIAATVTDAAGHSLDLTVRVSVDRATGTVHGTVSAAPTPQSPVH